MIKRCIWCLFPRFPIQIWSPNVSISLADKIGCFMHMDKEMLYEQDKWVVEILVDLDESMGLPPEIEINWGEG